MSCTLLATSQRLGCAAADAAGAARCPGPATDALQVQREQRRAQRELLSWLELWFGLPLDLWAAVLQFGWWGKTARGAELDKATAETWRVLFYREYHRWHHEKDAADAIAGMMSIEL